MIIRREILEAMGAFEPSIPFFYDDTLLTLKTRLYGKRAVTVTASKMCHASGATNVWKMYFTTLNLQKANDILMFDVFQKPSDLVKAAFFSVANAVINIVLTCGNETLPSSTETSTHSSGRCCIFPLSGGTD
jgi:GT2 family glycosyltransferase